MTFVLSKEFRFEAAHRLPCHDGKCARLHGHSWLLTVYVEGENIIDSGPKSGMVLDYADIKKAVKPLLEDYLDHHFLNETLGIENPTSELVAQWVYERLRTVLPLKAVRINETCTSSCLYSPQKLSFLC